MVPGAGFGELGSLVPAFDPAWAVFLDVDGTLLDLGERPSDVTLRPGLTHTLGALRRVVPVALVSGRPLADLDRLFAPLVLPAAGQHGAERRGADGRMHRAPVSRSALERARAPLAAWTRDHQGTLLEDKGATLALHFRGAPNLEAEAGRACHDALQRLGDGFLLGTGNMVLEIRPRGWDKGRALAEFMREAPFAGRVPVFVGDDITDEDGFRAANRLGGLSVKVGDGPSAAGWRLAGVRQVLDWLDRFVQWSASFPLGG
ncbi:MAG: trehalose-phosphatase [Acidobacteria bacterium 21-70-11]|nr:MAG: trehalose-phosphatase [Acidobacteria bacterium 21-70-11]OYW05708.1 MAG: trehalose-phosphatase [Acidobacteria bacterium 37-71-11]HQT94787.1 trehalose-phosphatase [Thermoanaerobaculaceae bacterium]